MTVITVFALSSPRQNKAWNHQAKLKRMIVTTLFVRSQSPTIQCIESPGYIKTDAVN